MARHSSAAPRERTSTPHEELNPPEETSTTPDADGTSALPVKTSALPVEKSALVVIDASLKRRARLLITKGSIPKQTRSLIRYALERKDPRLAELVENIEDFRF